MARYPLDSNPIITSTHGQATGMGFFGKHLGIDRAVVNRPVFAPAGGKMIGVGYSGSIGNYIEFECLGYHWRYAHLSRIDVKSGSFKEGQQLGISGNTGATTGPHLHYDARKLGTAWNASFNNYVDPDKLIANANKPQTSLPAVGSKIQLLPVDTRTTFKAGTATQVGTIRVTDNSFIYTIRGYDPVYKNRVIINSASAGGNGVSLALYYLSGAVVPGWKRV